ncbi:MAG: sigma-70 family RNA polymerase sigma factor [Candidatus Aenigmarchaeota archaeon]|nr:sigma-70 family RNA polymerase sigma factor [Candidatus Aenigmarchaeota archaeon]
MDNENVNIRERILLKKALETGDADAISEIYSKYKPFLKKYLANISNLNGYSEDLTHDLFLAICSGQCKYNGNTDVQGYLCGMAKRLALISNIKDARQHTSLGDNFSEEIAQNKLDEPLENLNIEEIRASLMAAVSTLPEKSRQAVELVIFHNIRPYQAAKKVGCSPAALRGRLSCGFNILRRKLLNFPKKFEL